MDVNTEGKLKPTKTNERHQLAGDLAKLAFPLHKNNLIGSILEIELHVLILKTISDTRNVLLVGMHRYVSFRPIN